MARFADRAEFTVRWLPFQLVPDMSKEGVDKLEYYNKRFGAQRVAQMMPSMARWAYGEGVGAGFDARYETVRYSRELVHVRRLRAILTCMPREHRTGPLFRRFRRCYASLRALIAVQVRAARACHTCCHQPPP